MYLPIGHLHQKMDADPIRFLRRITRYICSRMAAPCPPAGASNAVRVTVQRKSFRYGGKRAFGRFAYIQINIHAKNAW